VELKLLLTEYRTWMSSGVYGAHQPSATTLPCRKSIMLWISPTLPLPSASTSASTPAELRPSASGVLRGKGDAIGALVPGPTPAAGGVPSGSSGSLPSLPAGLRPVPGAPEPDALGAPGSAAPAAGIVAG
jgi:hypothetical protein